MTPERPSSVAYPGFQRGGCLSSGLIRKAGGLLSVSGAIRKAGGGGRCCRFLARYEKRWGGGCAVGFWPDMKSEGGGGEGVCCRFLARYEMRGGGGGGAIGFWPNTGTYLECAGGGC